MWFVGSVAVSKCQYSTLVYNSLSKIKRFMVNNKHVTTTKARRGSYEVHKSMYGTEEYLVKLVTVNRIYESKLRTRNNKLLIVTGRYHDVRREERYCDEYNDGQRRDEYDLLLQCQNQNIYQLQNRYIPEYYGKIESHQIYYIDTK